MIIRGQREKVYEAEVDVRRLIADLPQYLNIEMFIPENMCGYLIGKNGSNFKQIRDSSKARLDMDRKIIDNLENKNFSRLIISGTHEQIAAAKVMKKSVRYSLQCIDSFPDFSRRTFIAIRTETIQIERIIGNLH